jgi:hypothetical protein
MEEGIKYDGGKVRMELVPLLGIEAVAKVITFGSAKYGEHNWRKGLKFGRIQGAMLRHLTAIEGGEELDPESGLPHAYHVACNAIFLATFVAEGRKDLDDLYKVKE